MNKNVINEFNVLVDRAGGQNTSRMNELHGEVVTELDRLGLTDLVKKVQTCEAYNQVVGDTLEQLQQWGKKNLLPDATTNVANEPEPPKTYAVINNGAPVDPLPCDAVTRKFGPMYQYTVYTTHAEEDGYFSFATGSGNSYNLVYVNGDRRIDGSMDKVPVRKGDEIKFSIATPAVQDVCFYTLSAK